MFVISPVTHGLFDRALAPIPGSNPASRTGRVLSHLSIQMTLYSVNSINAIPDITFPQFRGLFPLIYERKRPKKISACPPESRKQKKGRTQQERPVPFCSTFAFEKWNILFLVFIGLLGQPSKNPFHFHLKNGTGSFPYSSASPRNVPLVPLFPKPYI